MSGSTASSSSPEKGVSEPRYLRVKDVAHRWSVSEGEVRRLVEAGELRKVHIGTTGRFFRITTESVRAYEAALPEARP